MREATFIERIVCRCGAVIEIVSEGSAQFPLQRKKLWAWFCDDDGKRRAREIEYYEVHDCEHTE